MANDYGQSQPTTGVAAFVYGADGKAVNTDSSGRLLVANTGGTGVSAAQVQGTAAAGGAGVGNPVMIAGQDGANVRTLLVDATGRLLANVNTEGLKATYSAATNSITLPASAVDTVVITGSGTKTVRVTRIAVSGVQTTAGFVPVILVLRSSANTGGSNALTLVPHDSNSAAATATVKTYTTVPSPQGTFVGIVRASRLFLPAPAGASANAPLVWDFTTRNGQGLVLRGAAQILAVNFNGLTITGGSIDADVEWTEE